MITWLQTVSRTYVFIMGSLPQLTFKLITASIQWLGSSKRHRGLGSNSVILIYILTYWHLLNFKMAECLPQWHMPQYLVWFSYTPLLHLSRSCLQCKAFSLYLVRRTTVWLHPYLLSSITTFGAGDNHIWQEWTCYLSLPTHFVLMVGGLAIW